MNNIEPEHDANFKAPVAPEAEAINTAITESLAREIAATQSAVPEVSCRKLLGSGR